MRAAFQMEMRLMRLALVLMCAQGAPALHTTLGSGALVPVSYTHLTLPTKA